MERAMSRHPLCANVITKVVKNDIQHFCMFGIVVVIGNVFRLLSLFPQVCGVLVLNCILLQHPQNY